MTPNSLTVGPGDPILEAASYMGLNMGLKNFRRIPVVNQQTLVGMLSIGDIKARQSAGGRLLPRGPLSNGIHDRFVYRQHLILADKGGRSGSSHRAVLGR